MDKVIFQCAGTTAEVQRAQGCHTVRNITDDDNDDADSTDHLLWVRHYFFFQRSLYLGLKLLKIKFKDIVYEYPCNTHEIFYQILKININLNFLIVNKIVAGC